MSHKQAKEHKNIHNKWNLPVGEQYIIIYYTATKRSLL